MTLVLAFNIWGLWVGRVFSSLVKSSSYNFSPGLNPVTLISMSFPISSPLNLIIFLAKSIILTDSPMSKTKISPPSPIAPASNTNWQASGIVMKKRVIRSSVKVIGPPWSICFWNKGITEPLDPKTFPKRVVTNFVDDVWFTVWA